MILGIYMSLGDSFTNLSKSGQDVRFKKFYIDFYSKYFEKIYIFTYADEQIKGLPKNVMVIGNRWKAHRYLYGLLLPVLNYNYIKECDIFRVYHLSGTIPAIIGKILLNKKYVFNFAYNYESFALIEEKKFQYLLFKLLKPIALLFAYKVIAANKTIINQIKTDKTVYIPNGVDINFFKPKKESRENRVIRILSIGRLERQKNFINLVKALKGLQVKLIIVGTGSLNEKIEEVAKLNKITLELIPKVNNLQMPKVYNSADIFVLPSLSEGHPKVLLEAMSCGLVCIGSNVEGIKEIIIDNKTGILCKPSVRSIRQAVTYVISRDLRDLGKVARKHIKRHYELKVLLEKEMEVLQKT